MRKFVIMYDIVVRTIIDFQCVGKKSHIDMSEHFILFLAIIKKIFLLKMKKNENLLMFIL